jgi:hypothetical protein
VGRRGVQAMEGQPVMGRYDQDINRQKAMSRETAQSGTVTSWRNVSIKGQGVV